jgi:choline dehydrogenase-like flavoprotein
VTAAEKPVEHFEAVVVGTGFAGAVTACRLVQAGRRICVLERGRRYGPDDLPVYPDGRRDAGDKSEYVQPDFSRLFWKLGQGLWDVRSLGNVTVGQAAGFGGGSLIYANVHLRAPAEVFDAARWPPEYTRAKLEPYYDLAGFMLGVTRMPEDPALPRTTRLRDAATSLGREGFFFRPPLAVRFAGEEKENAWRRPQGNCDWRGDCSFGCRLQAKNTLDLNYLAVAEDAFDEARQEFLADIRTLAEVVSIEYLGRDPRRYRLHYLDHLTGVSHPVDATYVFLCAGAVNTTELLLRSRAEKNLPVAGGRRLGTCYHPNADALAAVFDCDEPQEADRGPTITGALVHRDQKHWLLVQDGGMPAALEPFLGVFRSPLWARRNRHREGKSAGSARPRVSALAALPFGGVLDVFAGLTRSALPPALSLALFESLAESPRAEERGGGWRLVPPAFEKHYEALRDELLHEVAAAAEPRVDDFLRKSAGAIEREYDLERDLFARLAPPGFDPTGIERLHLAHQVLHLGLQLGWGSHGALVTSIAKDIFRDLVPAQDAWVNVVFRLLGWVLDYRIADGHTVLLLCMGRDSKPGRLWLERTRAGPVLRARLPRTAATPERPVQDRLLRDIAAAWGGELRTDPTWSFLGSRITVHSQGGCPMAPEDRPGVTNPDGKVRGCEGLYVMDAAAFPTSVGVNPSATIAAIAERKVEDFIHHVLKKPDWRADEREQVRSWAQLSQEERDALDPIGAIAAAESPQPEHQPIGIEFQERISGYYDRYEGISFAIDKRPGPAALERGAYEEGERAGIRNATSVEVKLTARIADLALFLELHRNGGRTRIPVDGALTLRLADGQRREGAIARGGRSHIALQRTRLRERTRELYYELHAGFEGEPWVLRGRKMIRDDPGFDIWEDTATLFFELQKSDALGPLHRGVLRLAANDFFETQIRSFVVTGTDDPAREVWALAAFGQYFFGQLVNVYLPELGRAAAFLKDMGGRMHV